MKTINEQLAALVKESGCGLYVTASSEADIKWQAVECRVSEGCVFTNDLRSGFGVTPEAAIADCKAQDFVPFDRATAATPGDDAVAT